MTQIDVEKKILNERGPLLWIVSIIYNLRSECSYNIPRVTRKLRRKARGDEGVISFSPAGRAHVHVTRTCNGSTTILFHSYRIPLLAYLLSLPLLPSFSTVLKIMSFYSIRTVYHSRALFCIFTLTFSLPWCASRGPTKRRKKTNALRGEKERER